MDFYDDGADAVQTRGPRHATRVPDEVGEGIHHRMAAMRVRYLSDQHGCQAHRAGICHHPNHRRDMDLLQEMLAALGLDQTYPAYTAAENRTWLKWIGQSGPAEDLAA